MDKFSGNIEQLWENLLSGEDTVIRETFHQLDLSDQDAVIEHLIDMAEEPGWQPEQRISAQVALTALGKRRDQEK